MYTALFFRLSVRISVRVFYIPCRTLCRAYDLPFHFPNALSRPTFEESAAIDGAESTPPPFFSLAASLFSGTSPSAAAPAAKTVAAPPRK